MIEPYYFKIAADIIAEPISSIYKLSLSSNIIAIVWKSAMALHLLKGGDLSDQNNYRPVFRLSVMAKVFETLVKD